MIINKSSDADVLSIAKGKTEMFLRPVQRGRRFNMREGAAVIADHD
jgi:hypothetical protein